METILRNITSLLHEAAALILAFLFTSTAISKLYDWQATKLAMYNQVIPDWSKDILLVGVPAVELGVSALLLVPAWRKLGFQTSVFLLTLFTGYVAWVWLGLAGRVPCSCGGVISSLTWGEHLVFNLLFLGISYAGYWLIKNPKALEQ
jgi:hypothetical protein